MTKQKKLYIGTNLKMYKTIAETVGFLGDLQELTKGVDRSEAELFVIPSYTALDRAKTTIKDNSIKLGAQNMYWEDQGQFTGEISPLMLKEIGIDIIEIGHSERRHVLGETDDEVNKKVLAALQHGFTALLCIGETGEQKEDGLSNEILSVQLKRGLRGVDKSSIGKLWVAYEPVWAIGTSGTPASAEYADEKHDVIKSVLKELYGQESSRIPVLYGGSVNPDNAPELIVMPHIDGLFIGRSAWNAENFSRIINCVLPLFKSK